MRNTSALWKTLWAQDDVILESVAVINNVTYTSISNPVIERAAMQGGLSIGNVVSASCRFTVKTNNDIPQSAKVVIKMRLTDGTSASEWLEAGTFYISHRRKDPIAGTIELECYDALLRAESSLELFPWTDSDGHVITDKNGNWLYFSAIGGELTYEDLLKNVMTILEVDLDSRTSLFYPTQYTFAIEQGMTLRDALSAIATVEFGNWIMTQDNKLRLIRFHSTDTAQYDSDVVNAKAVIGSLDIVDIRQITGIKYIDDIESKIKGNTSGMVVDVDITPQTDVESKAEFIYQMLVNDKYQAYTLSGAIYDPATEIGDTIVYDDLKSTILDEKCELAPAFRGDISAPEADENTDEYRYATYNQKTLAQAQIVARRSASAISAAAITDYDSSLNQQAVFDKLTDGGETQGIELREDPSTSQTENPQKKIYLNADYLTVGEINADLIQTGHMSADRISGGTIDGETVSAKNFTVINDDGDIIAKFSDELSLGEEGNTVLRVLNDSIELLDNYKRQYFYAGDLRDANGVARLKSAFFSRGEYDNTFYILMNVLSIISVSVNGAKTDNYTLITQSNGAIRINDTLTRGDMVLIEYTTDSRAYAYTFGTRSIANEERQSIGAFSIAEGFATSARGFASHSEGREVDALGQYSHAEGSFTAARGYSSHAEGQNSGAEGHSSHAEGSHTQANGDYSHSEGYYTQSEGYCGHSEGYYTIADASGSHAEGNFTRANGVSSHAEGSNTIADGDCQHVFGQYNVSDSAPMEIVGNGSSTGRANIRTLDRAGNEWIAGTLTQSSDASCKDETGEVPDVSEIKAHRFKWNDTKGQHDDVEHIGYYAQDVELVAPYLVGTDAMGHKTLDYIGFLCAKVSCLEKRIAELEKELK